MPETSNNIMFSGALLRLTSERCENQLQLITSARSKKIERSEHVVFKAASCKGLRGFEVRTVIRAEEIVPRSVPPSA